jgi:iron complex transport system permease protein
MKKRLNLPVLILILSPVVIVIALTLSIIYGTKSIDLMTIRDVLLDFESGDVNHQIIIHSRIPRAIGALLVGAFLAVSGAIMQGMTRNYLASPTIMGVSDGSAFLITLAMVFMPNTSSMGLVAFSFLGSLLGLALVFGMAALVPNGFSPVKLALIGTIIGTFLSGFSAAFATYFQVSQNISYWYNARLHQLNPIHIRIIVPVAIIGLIAAFLIAKSITILSLGEEIAIGLGQNTKVIKCFAMCTVAILTGVSVALVGKIGFVGLIIPHITRFLVGVDYKWIIPYSAVLGGIFLLLADLLSRFINHPFETPIGVVTSLIGVPFFLYLVHKKGGEKHV